MKVYFHTFEEFFDENMPGLYSHFKKHKVTPDLYITEWYELYYFTYIFMLKYQRYKSPVVTNAIIVRAISTTVCLRIFHSQT